jgi:hypothetical protein
MSFLPVEGIGLPPVGAPPEENHRVQLDQIEVSDHQQIWWHEEGL